MADSIQYQLWYEKARIDLNGAKILFKHDADRGLVAFHCQQAIEKQLKGWLLKTNGIIEEGHNLAYLYRIAIRLGAPLKEYQKDLAFVNQFYIETRYPSDTFEPVSDDEAADCLDVAEKVLSVLSDKP